MMKQISITLPGLLLLSLLLGSGLRAQMPTRYSVSIIPQPEQVMMGTGYFKLSPDAAISIPFGDRDFDLAARYLTNLLRPATGFELPIIDGPTVIRFQKDPLTLHPEGYQLQITPDSIQIFAANGAGAFYAVQTLRQLFPPEIENRQSVSTVDWSVPVVTVVDAPRFQYRGMHLDVCRHFFSVEFLKKYIDLLAFHKMNRFHWHLTEDQGWRIEIKKYPKLQSIAAYRNETLIGHYNDQPHRFDGQRYGGYYTQDEIREVVKYAAERFVTVVPEIELPGHSQAALCAYPELSCTGGPHEVATKWGVFDEVFCPKEQTFRFLEDVLTEVMELFPGQYIHIGGDECPKTRWKSCTHCQGLIQKEGLKDEHELQSYFIRRIERFLNDRGRSIIGWDEILEGGLAPNATVMSWRGVEGGIEAARQHHDVIMTPGSHCYFDHYQSQAPDEPLAIGGFTTVEKVYGFEPVPFELSEEEARHILGAQANLWTEYIKTPEKVEYMAYPRAVALAEVLWSQKEKRDFQFFTTRLGSHLERLDRLGVNYANHLFDVKAKVEIGKKGLQLNLSGLRSDGKIVFEKNGQDPTAGSSVYKEPIPIEGKQRIRAAIWKDNRRLSRVLQLDFDIHAAAGKPIKLANPPHPSYAAGGQQALINGINASDQRYGDGEWLGWLGQNFEATIDLQKKQVLHTLTMRFFNGKGQWIYLPRKVEVFLSDDGSSFDKIAEFTAFQETLDKVVPVRIDLKKAHGRHLKIRVHRYGIIPEGRAGGGHEAWLFVDELRVE